jgi:hypothetical protein
LGLTLGGAITGADSGISVVETGFGSISIATSGIVSGQTGRGIFAEDLAVSDTSNVTVAPTANVTGATDAIYATTFGGGSVLVTAGPNVSITGGFRGIAAVSNGTGSVSVMLATSDVITSNSTGIDAYSQATSISANAASTITVTAYGTIDSGAVLNRSSTEPAGVLAGYRGGVNNTINPNVFGNVTITNYANITASGGDGIRGFTYGTGNITITDEANTTIVAPGEFGIRTSNYGSGSESITTSPGDTINSGSAAVSAVNNATAIASSLGSSINVTSYGTINSGTFLTPSGSQPQGVNAGYFGASGVVDLNINGTVFIDNFANVTAAAGTGVNAFNYGSGPLTIKEESGTTVAAAQVGIEAASNSTGSGTGSPVTLNLLRGATVNVGALSGIVGVLAVQNNGSNVTISTSANDVINSGGSGISAYDVTTNAISQALISVTAQGTISSGFDMGGNGSWPAGIWAGYNPGDTSAFNAAVAGNVTLDNFATINAAAAIGIALYNWGTGNVGGTLESSSSITAPIAGVSAYAQGGGNVTLTNSGSITSDSGIGITAGSGTGLAISGTGTVSVTNSGTVTALGSSYSPVVQINERSTNTLGASFANTGTVSAILVNPDVAANRDLYPVGSTLNFAIADYNGAITVTNSNLGTISLMAT